MPPPHSTSDAAPSPTMGRAERLAMEEIALTTVRPLHAWCTIIVFLSVISAVCMMNFKVLANLPTGELEPKLPHSSDTTAQTFPRPLFSPAIEAVFAWNRSARSWIERTEDHITTQSPFSKTVQPWAQAVLAMAGEGGAEVMQGQDGWLYYRPSFRFLTKPDPLDGTHPASAPASGHAAALNAIRAFAEDLRTRDIQLVILPVWPKLSIQPEHFGAGTLSPAQPMFPAAYPAWRKQLESAGVIVFDPTSTLLAAKSTHPAGVYLKTDSHWNPAAMKLTAQALAEFLLERQLAAQGTASATESTTLIRNAGDLARMLRLPATLTEKSAETTEISVVRHANGARWLPNPASPVLLLGDSFCNIFSLKDMGWGHDAGFSEHLGVALRQPVDAILRNGDGAFATRTMLARDLNSGRDRLTGKSVVIWEFAASQITESTWPIIPCRTKATPNPVADESYLELADQETREITGTIAMMGPVPDPNSTVYKEYVCFLVIDPAQPPVNHSDSAPRTLAYGLVIQGNQWTALASVRPGQRIRAKLRSWTSAEEEFGRHQRCEPDGDLALQPVNWLETFSLVD